jgi:hypothetical protein
MANPTNSRAAAIIEAARSRSDIRILYATPLASLGTTPPEVLDQLEKDIGAKLPPEVRAFYLGAERLGLVWQEGTGEETQEQPAGWAELCNTEGPYWSRAMTSRDYSKQGGMICIPSAAEVFRKGYWIDRQVPEVMGDELELDGEPVDDKDLYEDLYPFDFVTTFYCVGLWFNRKRGEWRVVLGSDHGVAWSDYRTLSVAEYFAQLDAELGGPRTFVSNSGAEKTIRALRKEQ